MGETIKHNKVNIVSHLALNRNAKVRPDQHRLDGSKYIVISAISYRKVVGRAFDRDDWATEGFFGPLEDWRKLIVPFGSFDPQAEHRGREEIEERTNGLIFGLVL